MTLNGVAGSTVSPKRAAQTGATKKAWLIHRYSVLRGDRLSLNLNRTSRVFMCPLNRVGVPIFCPTTSYITTAKWSVCLVVSKFKFALILAFLCDWKLYCFLRKCLRVGFGPSRRPLICSEFVFNIPAWQKCALPGKTQNMQYFPFLWLCYDSW